MFRTKTCGELRLANVNESVTLSGWVQRARKMGGMTFVDLRDRYGITQLVFSEDANAELCEKASHLGREYVIQVTGIVSERQSKNSNIATGDIEIIVSELNILNEAATPPFTIENNTDGGDDIRMKYRYLDLRREAVRKNLELRHQMTMEVRRYLDSMNFIEVETPMLIASTPEGARDFVVPSRMNPGQFYALPQSPQLFKQLLMVSGFVTACSKTSSSPFACLENSMFFSSISAAAFAMVLAWSAIRSMSETVYSRVFRIRLSRRDRFLADSFTR